MTIAPLELSMLRPEYISEIYERAQKNEEVFRNTLLNCADNDEEIQLFKKRSLDSIFDKFVRVDGYNARVSDFRKGPFSEETEYSWKFPRFKSEELKENNALLFIEKSNCSWLKIYEVMENNTTKLIDTKEHHQL